MSSPSRNIKVVIIGASGVGKTSIRTMYTTGRISTGYRATIGTDFVTRTLPHYSDPEQSVTLQIWDTAGQERFSSLATAFFRGADAVILVFDVTKMETLQALKKWWIDFAERAPVEEGMENQYPVVVLANKIDLLESPSSASETRSNGSADPHTEHYEAIREEDIKKVLGEIFPPVPEQSSQYPNGYSMSPRSTSPVHDEPLAPLRLDQDNEESSESQSVETEVGNGTKPIATPDAAIQQANGGHKFPSVETDHNPAPSPKDNSTRKISISISPSSHPNRNMPSRSRATSRSRFYGGTMTSTTHTIYHTASSSLIDSSPPTPIRPGLADMDWSPPPSASLGVEESERRRVSSTSTGTATITPSLYLNQTQTSQQQQQRQQNVISKPKPPPLGPHIIYTSAKSGEGINEIFEYVAQRVIMKTEWEEWLINSGGGPGGMGMLETGEGSRIMLNGRYKENKKKGWRAKCCG